jgi:hypothetical protein
MDQIGLVQPCIPIHREGRTCDRAQIDRCCLLRPSGSDSMVAGRRSSAVSAACRRRRRRPSGRSYVASAVGYNGSLFCSGRIEVSALARRAALVQFSQNPSFAGSMCRQSTASLWRSLAARCI